MDNDRLLTQEEAADILGVSPSTMNGWRVQGRGPAIVRLSARCVRYRYGDVLAYIAANRHMGAEAKRIEQLANRQGA